MKGFPIWLKMLFLWMLPSLNMIIFNVILYSSIPRIIDWWTLLFVCFMSLHVVLAVVIPFRVSKYIGHFEIKEALFAVTSIVFSNFIFIMPEMNAIIQFDFYNFDEDALYSTIISISLIASLAFVLCNYFNNKIKNK